jgi:hypothetical protein
VLDQVSVEDWPTVIEVGLTEIETVGDCCAPPVTVNVALPLPVPPAPVQSRTYCNEPAALGVTVMLPTVCCAPVQAPLAVHEAASVLDQIKVVDWPTAIVDDARETETVGAGDGMSTTRSKD